MQFDRESTKIGRKNSNKHPHTNTDTQSRLHSIPSERARIQKRAHWRYVRVSTPFLFFIHWNVYQCFLFFYFHLFILKAYCLMYTLTHKHIHIRVFSFGCYLVFLSQCSYNWNRLVFLFLFFSFLFHFSLFHLYSSFSFNSPIFFQSLYLSSLSFSFSPFCSRP